NLRFAESPQNLVDGPKTWLEYFAFTKDDIMRGIELGVMLLLGLIVLLMVVRPLVRRMITPDKAKLADNGAGGLAIGTATIGGPNVIVSSEPATATISTHTSQMIDIAQVQGQVHAQSVQKVGELADRNPHETVSIIR